MLVTKRNKKCQVFDRRKIENTLKQVFDITHTELTMEMMNSIIDELELKDAITTNDIQTQLETILMKQGYYNQARFVIIFRHINYHSKSMRDKVRFMRDYIGASNAATGSKYDSNANVTEINLVTLSGELFKGDIIKLNRYILSNKIGELYGNELSMEYLRQLENHELYKHDESSLYPYCVAISMYPYLISGLGDIGGLSTPPKNLDSFCGSFINLVFAVSAQFAGACATGEFLMYFDYFARKDLGQDYYLNPDRFIVVGPEVRELEQLSNTIISSKNDLIQLGGNLEEPSDEIQRKAKKLLSSEKDGRLCDQTRTIKSYLVQKFQQIVYSVNQPTGARLYQSVFWNISYFDKYYFEGLFGNFYFPDGTKPQWESLSWIQKLFMKWFNEERTKCVITFPVETMAMLTDGKDIMDQEWADFAAEMYSEGHSFFTYLSDNPDSLSSCCRLRNEISDNTFSYSLGAGGIATGSKSVMTLNLNRLVQDAVKKNINYVDYLRDQVRKVHKYQTAYNTLLKEYEAKGVLQIYDAGFIKLNKQYLTIGINGFVEAAEFLGIPIKPCKVYQEFCDSILKVLYEENKLAKTKDLIFNTEFVPAENLGCKHAKWDKEAGYAVPRDCYNSYFYRVEDDSLSILDKFKLHGKEFVKYLDGGSALHLNLTEHLSKKQIRQLFKVASKLGTNYFTFNIPNTICEECNHISKHYLKECPKCGSKKVDYITRIIGYIKRIVNFADPRKKEAGERYYTDPSNQNLDIVD